jgi:DNA-binding MarR family transcriptional regulator
MSNRDSGPADVKRLGELNRIVHEPARLMLLAFLYAIECADFLYLEQQTGMTRGNMASHMRKLEEAGFVKVEKTFVEKIPRTLYQLTSEGRKAFVEYRQQITSVLQSLRP